MSQQSVPFRPKPTQKDFFREFFQHTHTFKLAANTLKGTLQKLVFEIPPKELIKIEYGILTSSKIYSNVDKEDSVRKAIERNPSNAEIISEKGDGHREDYQVGH